MKTLEVNVLFNTKIFKLSYLSTLNTKIQLFYLLFNYVFD